MIKDMAIQFRRRTFLSMTTASVAQGLLPLRARAEGSAFKPFVLILSGCDPAVDTEVLFKLIDPIVSHNIPIGFAVDPPVPTDDGSGAADEYVDVIRRLSSDLPGLFELMPDIASLDESIAYFQARKAFDVYGRFQAAFDLASGQEPVSLFSLGRPAQAYGVAGVRSSGFRSVFSPGSENGVTIVQAEFNGVLTISGGIVADATVPADDLRKVLDLAIQRDDFILVNLSLAGLKNLGPDEAFQQGSDLAVTIARRKALGQIVPNLPRDFHLRLMGSDYNRAITVCIDTSKAGDDLAEPYAKFVAALGKFSINVTQIVSGQGARFIGGADGEDAAPNPIETCRALDAAPFMPGGALENGAERPKCAAVTAASDTTFRKAFSIGLSTLLDVSRNAGQARGLDDSGVLRIPAAIRIPAGADGASVDIAGRLPGLIGNHSDVIVVVDAASISTESGRNLILRELSELASQSWSTFKTLDGFSNIVVPNYNHLELIRQSKFDRYLEASEEYPDGSENSAQMMEHAKLAWQYFAKGTDARTGLAPGAVFRSEAFNSDYEVITMWDVASHLNGAMCAAELGIITHEDLVERAKRVLKHLPSRKNLGLNLPVAEFQFASATPLDTDYNSCDTGRLLVALHLLSRVAELKDPVTQLVASWDLAKTVQNGKIVDISRQKMVDASFTNCSHYAGIGYGLWGIETDTPYKTPDGEGEFDKSVRLLNAVGNIGPYGAEPLLLEAVELGFSPESKILADILYSAQLSELHRSGDLVAASETPLDREPWFTYQGLDVNDADDPWKVFSIMTEARFLTPGFAYANRMLSTKAAFLWGAIRPGDFSAKLMQRATKDTALPGRGFVVGVYQSTDQPTFGYCDINTNGVVLEAIAYAMRGGKPMREVQF